MPAEPLPRPQPIQDILALKRRILADPDARTPRMELAALCLRLGRFEDVPPLMEGLLARDPGDGNARFHLAWALAALGRDLDALSAIQGHPSEGEWCLHLGTTAGNQGHWNAACRLCARALEREPSRGQAWHDLSVALDMGHRFEESARLLEEAAARFQEDPAWIHRFRFHLGENLLRRGRYGTGLPLLESRFALPGFTPLAPVSAPPWQGEDVAGRTLLVRTEQGFGDMFMFMRYAAILAERGAQVVLENLTGAREVLATADGLSRILEPGVTVLPEGTLQVPVMSLPRLCGTTADAVPAAVPYFHVPALVPSRSAIDEALEALPPGRRIGLVWSGNPKVMTYRSVPPEVMDLLGEVEGVAWVNLQLPGVPRPSLPMAGPGAGFADKAYLMSRLDGVITVDTGLCHLAGALGRPVWCLLSWLPDWRWGLDTDRSPWYPTMELWRQTAPGDWASLLARVAERLRTSGFP
jgi:hypothetical protein